MKAKIKDIYTYATTNNLNLFGNVSNFSFMAGYTANAEAFDYLFNKKFSSFNFLTDFNKSATLETVYNDFTKAIRSFLFFNNKRYTELYRVEVLAANAYDIVNNYDLTETSTRTSSGTTSTTKGARSDSDTYGAKSHTDIYGEREDNTEVSNGVQGSTTQKDIAGFNSPTYAGADKEITTIDANTSGGTSTKGEQTDTHSEATYTDTHSIGQQTDSGSTSGSESVNLRRYGNIGIATPADIIGGHISLWDNFNFYEIIFRELSREFLLLDDDYLIDSGSGSVFSQDDIAEIMQKLNSIQAQITSSTNAIQADIDEVRIDITDVHENIHEAESNIIANTNSKAASLALDISNLSASLLQTENAIKANDNSNTATIRSDITGVITNGY